MPVRLGPKKQLMRCGFLTVPALRGAQLRHRAGLTEEQHIIRTELLAVEVRLVTDPKTTGHSQRETLRVARNQLLSWALPHHTPGPKQEPVAHNARRFAAWLSDENVSAIIGKLQVAFGRGDSVHQGSYQTLNTGAPVASASSWYRDAAKYCAAERPVRARRNRRTTQSLRLPPPHHWWPGTGRSPISKALAVASNMRPIWNMPPICWKPSSGTASSWGNALSSSGGMSPAVRLLS